MKIKIKNYIISIEKQISLISKTPLIETQAICNGKKSIENTKNNDMQNLKDSRNEFKIGEYVQCQMRLLSNKNILSIQDVQKLQDLSYCKTKFNISFCVLIDQKLSVKDDKGYPRYYANDLYFNNYRLTSQWKEVHRKPFLNWLKTHIDIEVSNHKSSYSNSILPIELIPNDSEDFLQILLKTKEAEIITYYQNGTKDSKIWNASNMTAESNVIHNLRSRPEFRNPNWQKANIVKVVVEVNKNEINNKTMIAMKMPATIESKDSKSHTLENFKTYLIQQGYSEYTPSGNPSTVYDYGKRVNKILKKEKISIQKLTENIDLYVKKYDAYGSEEEFGKSSHNAFINALKRFQDFCK